ncbi:MAG: type II toxin-antitoxin system HicA family toxin [Firmicutes bacterium]|nr:type II toxin-antitoxin system HicA family toxin [Bacillota bacterium]
MGNIEKIIQKMHLQITDISFAELQKVLEYNGFQIVRQKGSHCFFRNKNGLGFTIPKTSPVKAIYVRLVLTIIEGDQK